MVLNLKSRIKDFSSYSKSSRLVGKFVNLIMCALLSQTLKPRFSKVPKYIYGSEDSTCKVLMVLILSQGHYS